MRIHSIVLITLAVLSVTGCKTNSLYFASAGHLGIDVSGNAVVPTHYSVSGSIQEFSIVPVKSDGSSHSIYGGMNADLNYFELFSGNRINQMFATGEAAICALYFANRDILKSYKTQCVKVEAIGSNRNSEITNFRDRTLVVSTKSVFGFDLHYGDGEAVGTNLGYKRLVLGAIPITNNDEEVGSVYLDVNVDSLTSAADCATTKVINCSAKGGMRIVQTVATGDAAKLMAIANSAELQKKATLSAK